MAEAKKEGRKIYHVAKREKDGKWALKIQGSDTVIKLFDTKKEAEDYCKTLGANQNGTILFHHRHPARKVVVLSDLAGQLIQLGLGDCLRLPVCNKYPQ